MPLSKMSALIGQPQSIVRRKLAAYEELERSVLQVSREQEQLLEKLLAEAPANLRDFLAEGWLEQALKYGHASGKASLDDVGCKTYAEAKAKFSKLKKFWDYVLSIKFPSEKQYERAGRLELVFSVFHS